MCIVPSSPLGPERAFVFCGSRDASNAGRGKEGVISWLRVILGGSHGADAPVRTRWLIFVAFASMFCSRMAVWIWVMIRLTTFLSMPLTMARASSPIAHWMASALSSPTPGRA